MKIRGEPENLGRLAALLIRIVGWTLRIKVEDRSRATDPTFKQPMIWAFWHNRMFAVPIIWLTYAPHRTGCALTSPSRDGSIVAGVMKAFGLKSIRGSSSRRGATALRELKCILESGNDVAIAPDGPRGPRYKVGGGLILLARQTGAAILPIRVEYCRAFRLKSWDRFMIPAPFSKVRVTLDELVFINPTEDAQTASAKLEETLRPETE